MYTYPVCTVADEEIFVRQCAAIEKYLQPLGKGSVLKDVDGSKIQPYEFRGQKVRVVNSLYTNEVYVESEIDIKPYFQSGNKLFTQPL